MIKGLAITPPVLGRISIGRVVEKNGKRLPEKDDQFTITTQVQVAGAWVPHPYDEELRKNAPNGKLRSIPVRMLFNDPDLNLRRSTRCSTGRRDDRSASAMERHAGGYRPAPFNHCPARHRMHAELAKGGMCKPYGRLNVKIGDDDELGTFIFRTTGFNSIRTLAARLSYYKAVSGNLLACLPLELRLRGKSTTQSHRGAIYYVDLAVREGMPLEEAISDAKNIDSRRKDAGLHQEYLDTAGREGFSNAAFEFSEEDGQEIVEEFFPDAESGSIHPPASFQPIENLREKLGKRTTEILAPRQS